MDVAGVMGSTIAARPSSHYDASEGQKFAADTTLAVVDCPTCGITYAIPESLKRSALKWHGDRPNGWKLCCPLGHVWGYIGETKNERLKRQLSFERDRSAHLVSRLDQTEASRTAYKAVSTRARNEKARLTARVANGVCPCCGRTFKQLARHMAAKQPDYLEEGS